MSIIIDGYNVLKTCGFLGNQVGPGTLERARGMFVGMLIQGMNEEERRQVSIVFDSALRRPDLPDQLEQDGIEIHFASGHQDADEMIIEMIQHHSAPKTLLIVSSDHQIQTAATRRKAAALDSEVWFDQWTRESRNVEVQKTAAQLKTELTLEKKKGNESLGPEESQKWLAQFVSQPVVQEPDSPVTEPSSPPTPSREQTRPSKPKRKQKSQPPGFQSTSLEELAGRAQQMPAEASETSDDSGPAVPREDASNRDSHSIRLDEIEISDSEIPELNLGQSMEQASLRHDSLMPEDLDQWLEDFDDQFQKTDLSGGQPIKPKEARPSARQSRPTDPAPSIPDRPSSDASAVDPPAAPTQPPPASQEATAGSGADSSVKPPIDVDQRQMDRWNRQLEDTDDQIFPPGYAEDILFAETFETDPRLKRKRRP